MLQCRNRLLCVASPRKPVRTHPRLARSTERQLLLCLKSLNVSC
jgi:hypothetical protein